MRSFIFASLSLLPVACSAAGADSSTADQAATGAAAMCTTLDYDGPAAADYYRFFDSDESAGAFIDGIVKNGQLAGAAGPDAKLREITRDPRWVGLIDEVFAGFQKAFPKETAGLTKAPPVAIVESSIKNAYALGAGVYENDTAPRDRAPYVFIVHTAISDGTFTDDQIRGLVAHEMGHLILKTFVPAIQKRLRAIYKVPVGGNATVFGAVQPNDPTLEAHVNAILDRQTRIGGIEFLGVPMFDPGAYMKILKSLADSAPTSDACTRLKAETDTLRALQISLVPDVGAGDLVPTTPTAAQRAELDRQSAAFTTDLLACVAPVDEPASLADIAAAINQTPLPTELQIDAEMPTATIATRLVRAEAALRGELVALRTDPTFPIDQIRVFDYEEDADDASARVLTVLGHDPSGVGQFVLELAPPDAKAKCLADVAAGRPISYGQFFDTHETSCWRYFHTMELGKTLQTCR